MHSIDCGWTALLLLSSVLRAGEVTAPVADAAEKNDAAAVRALLEEGSDINLPQVDGTTALHWAVYHDEDDLTRLLIKAGADVEAVNRYGVPPLSIACMNGNGKIVEMLLDAAPTEIMLDARRTSTWSFAWLV